MKPVCQIATHPETQTSKHLLAIKSATIGGDDHPRTRAVLVKSALESTIYMGVAKSVTSNQYGISLIHIANQCAVQGMKGLN
jgi:hypothetical protein